MKTLMVRNIKKRGEPDTLVSNREQIGIFIRLKDRNNGLASYSSTRILFENRFEASEETTWIMNRRALLDVSLACLVTLLELDNRR